MSNLNIPLHPEYDIDYIEKIMSLRAPQKRSVKILDDILSEIDLNKLNDLNKSGEQIHDMYNVFKNFEHNFMSLAFALATGVGKTRLMGAFMTYLYTNKGVRNFFVVAPNLTIYNKLKNDLGNPSSLNSKYVFRGVGCFENNTPNVWIDDDYRNRPARSTIDNDSINIYIFNVAKFNSEDNKINGLNEYIGQSFFDYLKSMEDLVVIMDESHHYRAAASFKAINELNPVLGLEVTATPQVTVGSKQRNFANVVYEYPLSKAIKDGYTRTPYAITRKDIKTDNFTDNELDKTMLMDGINHHENMKVELKTYSVNNNQRLVKPFVLVVCKNTEHATEVLEYIKSDSFKNGYYKDKVLLIHSNQKKTEKDENIQLLLEVEDTNNPIEIVIHVNILKEGWDVNNLYTIIPLRTATSKVLREQTVGRGLRLPFGRRTGIDFIDGVMITAHDKFDEIVKEAASGDSIFNANGVIYAEDNKPKKAIPQTLHLFDEDTNDYTKILEQVSKTKPHLNETPDEVYEVVNKVVEICVDHKRDNMDKQVTTIELKEKCIEDLGNRITGNENLTEILEAVFHVKGDSITEKVNKKVMYIPKIKTEKFDGESYTITDFDLDMSTIKFAPIETQLLIQSLINSGDYLNISTAEYIIHDETKPEKLLVDALRKISFIDYEKSPEIIKKVVLQFLNFHRTKYSEVQVKNICLMYKNQIIKQMEKQLLENLVVKYSSIVDVIEGVAPEAIQDIEKPDVAFIGGSSSNLIDIVETILKKNNKARIVITAITLETVTEAITVLKKFTLVNQDIASVNIAKSKKIGSYNMMMGQNPIYIITGEGDGSEI